jgi:hypothetical protein
MVYTENVQPTPQAEPHSDTAVGSNPWLAAVDSIIEAMKYREAKYHRESEDALLKAEAVQTERMELEHALYKAKLRS